MTSNRPVDMTTVFRVGQRVRFAYGTVAPQVYTGIVKEVTKGSVCCNNVTTVNGITNKVENHDEQWFSQFDAYEILTPEQPQKSGYFTLTPEQFERVRYALEIEGIVEPLRKPEAGEVWERNGKRFIVLGYDAPGGGFSEGPALLEIKDVKKTKLTDLHKFWKRVS